MTPQLYVVPPPPENMRQLNFVMETKNDLEAKVF